MSDETRLTPAEKMVLDYLAEATKAFKALPVAHTSDESEFCFYIHALQNLIGWRVAQRADPDYWRPAPQETSR